MNAALPSTSELVAAASVAGSSVEIERIAAEAQDALAHIAARVKAARDELLDPMKSEPEAARLKAELDSLDVAAGRMSAALGQINKRLNGAREDEANAKHLAAYDATEAAGNALAQELRDVYPVAARQIAHLLRRIDEHERATKEVNRTLPKGKPALVPPEVSVRGMNGIEQGYANLRNSVRLAALDMSEERNGHTIWAIVNPGCGW